MCINKIFLNIFDKTSRIMTSLNFSFISFLPFWWFGVISATFKNDGNVNNFFEPFILEHKYSANIPAFSFMILV